MPTSKTNRLNPTEVTPIQAFGHKRAEEFEEKLRKAMETADKGTTPKGNFRKFTLKVDNNTILLIEQNPKTKSKWARLAEQGHAVWQVIWKQPEGFKDRYLGVVINKRYYTYGK